MSPYVTCSRVLKNLKDVGNIRKGVLLDIWLAAAKPLHRRNLAYNQDKPRVPQAVLAQLYLHMSEGPPVIGGEA